jgi:mannose-6-phosphate isomerase-like protein (cupin superfamily)
MRDFRVFRMTTLISADDSGGAIELIEDIRSAGEGPAPHVHHLSDEGFLVLEGDFTFTYGDDELLVQAGAAVFVARGTRHCYRANADDSRLLIICAPAGLEGFLRAMDDLLAQGHSSEEAMVRLSGKFDCELML